MTNNCVLDLKLPFSFSGGVLSFQTIYTKLIKLCREGKQLSLFPLPFNLQRIDLEIFTVWLLSVAGTKL